MNTFVVNADIDHFLNQSDLPINTIVAGMTAIIEGNDERIEKLQNQNWFQKAFRTIIGTNKATREEIKRNHEKLSSYSVMALKELYKRGRITNEIVISLGNRINDVYQSQLEQKQQAGVALNALNNKVNAVENRVDDLQQAHLQLVETLGLFASKLNEKIESIDKFHILCREIDLDMYGRVPSFFSSLQDYYAV